MTATRTQITAMNAVVDSVALRPFVARVDLAGLLATIAAEGWPLGGNLYTSEFITGGLFSLDGVHPNDLGYALLANALIGGVNAKWGCAIPLVNALDYSSSSASAAQPVLGSRYPRSAGDLQESLRMLLPRQP